MHRQAFPLAQLAAPSKAPQHLDQVLGGDNMSQGPTPWFTDGKTEAEGEPGLLRSGIVMSLCPAASTPAFGPTLALPPEPGVPGASVAPWAPEPEPSFAFHLMSICTEKS